MALHLIMLPPDYHIHTHFCDHGFGEPEEYAARAVNQRLDEIGFSEHCPMFENDFDHWHMRFDQLGEYVQRIQKAQQDYPNLSIKLSLEVDYIPGCEDWVRNLAKQHAWDYFIGSVHYVSDSWALDNPEMMHLLYFAYSNKKNASKTQHISYCIRINCRSIGYISL